MEPEFELMPTDRPVYHIKGEIEVKDLEYKLDNGVRLFSEVSFHVRPGGTDRAGRFFRKREKFPGHGVGTTVPLPIKAHVLLDGHELRELTKMDVTCNIGFVAQHPFIFNGTVRDNLLYGSRALLLAEGEGRKRTLPSREKVFEMLRTVGLAEDVTRFGLNMIIPRECCEPMVKHFIWMRQLIRERFGEKLTEVVEPFDVNNFLHYSTIHDNLFFSDVYPTEYLPENLPYNRAFLKFLADMKLDEPLVQLGMELAQKTVSLFEDLGENECFFFESSPMQPESFETYKTIVPRLERGWNQNP